MDLDNPGCSSHAFHSSYSNTTDSLNQLWQCHPFSVLWLFRDHQFSGLVAVELQFVIDDSGSPIPNWYPKFCTPKNRSVLVNSGSGKDITLRMATNFKSMNEVLKIIIFDHFKSLWKYNKPLCCSIFVKWCAKNANFEEFLPSWLTYHILDGCQFQIYEWRCWKLPILQFKIILKVK